MIAESKKGDPLKRSADGLTGRLEDAGFRVARALRTTEARSVVRLVVRTSTGRTVGRLELASDWPELVELVTWDGSFRCPWSGELAGLTLEEWKDFRDELGREPTTEELVDEVGEPEPEPDRWRCEECGARWLERGTLGLCPACNSPSIGVSVTAERVDLSEWCNLDDDDEEALEGEAVELERHRLCPACVLELVGWEEQPWWSRRDALLFREKCRREHGGAA